MSALSRAPGSQYVNRSSSSGLYDVLDLLLDKGLVIDVFLRVSLVGIELLTVDARIVIASVDTYLRFAEAVNRLDLGQAEGEGLPQIMDDMTEGGASSKTKGVLEGAREKLFGSDDDDDDSSRNGGSEENGGSRRRSSSSRSGSSSSRSASSSSRSRSPSGSSAKPRSSSRGRSS
ncbi:MAG TPA: gas vesicle protein GvpJ [Solirubrobacteraceae bacterium]|nr:gas vesicle protein GvpJ [Solirubrobacteraceae bacterium]